ncbi:MAG: glycogen debranching protein GlgX [Isosphaeraceae bacterium]
MRVWIGHPNPLGAIWDGMGVNFALFAENATKVELCIFDRHDTTKELERIPLPEKSDQVWHGYLPDARPGLLYGYRVHGPYEPQNGLRFNPNKLLLDPYARAVGRDLTWDDSLYGYKVGDPIGDLSFDDRDSGRFAPLGMVVESAYSWGADRAPRIPWQDSVIYELHVKGFTQRHPEVPEQLRGTYAGLASPAVIDELVDLGVTAVELLPVHYHVDDRFLVDKGKVNYWGYSSLGFFAPDPRYAATRHDRSNAVAEFKYMVRNLHSANIEVILDVVYNHTAEGNQMGPTLCWRGVDNAAYYNLAPDPRYYMDFTGCGNTPRMQHPRVLQLIMDSLRYWVTEMHVDGFRFDLAATLARELHDVDKLSSFFDVIQQDPVLSNVKLIAEPWDVGPGGYMVGNFPVGWTEWNGKYRDCVRRFWKGDGGTANELATRLTGSSDLYSSAGRRPHASINFVTCHDGFSLQDLVSYNQKHNEDNGEDNRDGSNDNDSWNCGAEGPTDDPGILALRAQQRRNFLATLLLSQGVPMLLAGDERGHTQDGNNNTYCQDNDLTWLSWEMTPERRELRSFVRKLIHLRREHPVFRRRKFFEGRSIRGTDVKDIYWINPDGSEMSEEDWRSGLIRCLGMGLIGTQIEELDPKGRPIRDDVFLILFNADHNPVEFNFHGPRTPREWSRVLDTAAPFLERPWKIDQETYPLAARSLALLCLGRTTRE